MSLKGYHRVKLIYVDLLGIPAILPPPKNGGFANRVCPANLRGTSRNIPLIPFHPRISLLKSLASKPPEIIALPRFIKLWRGLGAGAKELHLYNNKYNKILLVV